MYWEDSCPAEDMVTNSSIVVFCYKGYRAMEENRPLLGIFEASIETGARKLIKSALFLKGFLRLKV